MKNRSFHLSEGRFVAFRTALVLCSLKQLFLSFPYTSVGWWVDSESSSAPGFTGIISRTVYSAETEVSWGDRLCCSVARLPCPWPAVAIAYVDTQGGLASREYKLWTSGLSSGRAI